MEENNSLNKFMIDDAVYETQLTKKYLMRKPYKPLNTKQLNAFIPGTIREIFVKEGDNVRIGDKLLILEAMKMKNTVAADQDGKIKLIPVRSGQSVAKNDLMLEFE